MKINRSTLAGHLVVGAVLCALFVSGASLNALNLNYSADTSAGGMKLHPYTLLTVAAVIALSSGSNALKNCLKSHIFRTGVTGAAVTIAILCLKTVSGAGQSLGFAVDTIVSGFLLAAVLPFVSPRVVRKLSRIALLFLVVECILAMGEAVTQINVLPIDTWYGAYFRATALHGHPLNNALILVTVATALQVSARWQISVSVFFLTVGALMAFGARGALAAYLSVNAVAFLGFGLRSTQRALILMIGGMLSIACLFWLVVSGIFGDRIAQVGAYDDSSQVRVQSLGIVQHLNWPQVLFGNDSDTIVRLMDQADVGVVENFLVGYLLMFGAVLTAIIFYLAYKTCRALTANTVSVSRKQLLTILFVFTCTALTNNSLMTKTPALFILMVGLWCASCRSSEKIKRSNCQSGSSDSASSIRPVASSSIYEA
jgi:hypothetical protein